jgi:glycosyltransferase involved in cell wall biosynthesis
MTKKKLLIVIPVYNEQSIINKVVKDWLKIVKKYKGLLLIINDGSTDLTLRKIKQIKSKKVILINQKNQGHGIAALNGYKYGIKNSFRFIFQVDSDNQFSIKNFPKFWALRNKYDLVLGHRRNRHDPFSRLVITRMLKFFILFRFKIYILDANVPYRLINGEKLKIIINKIPEKTPIPNIWISILFNKNNIYRCLSIPVIHKLRRTGTVWILKWKLVKFCINAFLELSRANKK